MFLSLRILGDDGGLVPPGVVLQVGNLRKEWERRLIKIHIKNFMTKQYIGK